jgi:hypothetical protein
MREVVRCLGICSLVGLGAWSCGSDTDSESDGPVSGMCDGDLGVQLDADGEPTDAPVGIEGCSGEVVHRYAAPSCIAEPEIACVWGDGCDEVGGGGCPAGEACADDPYLGGCHCITPCMGDDDCNADEFCLCPFEGVGGVGPGYGLDNGVRHCVPAGCRTDADCAPYRCGIVIGDCGGVKGTRCHTALDECEGTEQCSGHDNFDPRCGYDEDAAHWACSTYAECEN